MCLGENVIDAGRSWPFELTQHCDTVCQQSEKPFDYKELVLSKGALWGLAICGVWYSLILKLLNVFNKVVVGSGGLGLFEKQRVEQMR